MTKKELELIKSFVKEHEDYFKEDEEFDFNDGFCMGSYWINSPEISDIRFYDKEDWYNTLTVYHGDVFLFNLWKILNNENKDKFTKEYLFDIQDAQDELLRVIRALPDVLLNYMKQSDGEDVILKCRTRIVAEDEKSFYYFVYELEYDYGVASLMDESKIRLEAQEKTARIPSYFLGIVDDDMLIENNKDKIIAYLTMKEIA